MTTTQLEILRSGRCHTVQGRLEKSRLLGHVGHIARTPFVLGTSSESSLWIASRIASASALNADSALRTSYISTVPKREGTPSEQRSDVLVVVVLSSNYVDVQRDSRPLCKGLEDVGNHLR